MSRKTIESNSQDRGGLQPESIEQRRPGFDRVYNREGEAAESCLEDYLMSIEDIELQSGCIVFTPLREFRDTQVSVILSYDKRDDKDDDITHMIQELTLQLDLRS